MSHSFNHRPVPRVCEPVRSAHPDTVLYGFVSENIFTKLKIRNYKKWKNLGGKGMERRWLSRFMRVYSEISEEWQTAIEKLMGLAKSPNGKIWSRHHGSKGMEIKYESAIKR